MNANLYYTPPNDKSFNEVKEKSIELWSEYDDEYGYATDKINSIKDIENVSDNFMYMIAMFDIQNQKKLSLKLSDTTRADIRQRLISGGSSPEYIMF